MKTICITSILGVALLAGCTSGQLAQLQSDETLAEQAYAATTQATAVAQQSLAALPPNAPGLSAATQVVASAEKGEQAAQLALNVARAALTAAQQNDAASPALTTSLMAAISAIPSPWTPILASLLPAAIPLVVSVIQSVKLGKAHQTVAHVTEQLDAHKAALAAVTAAAPAASIPATTPAAPVPTAIA